MKSHQPYPQQGVAVTCRSFEEYVRMFSLDEEQLSEGSVLDIASGASSFAAEASAKGFAVHAVDPRYGENPEQAIETARREIETSTQKLAVMQEQYDWSYYGSLELHRKRRELSLKRFAEHYRSERNKRNCVYKAGELPNLPAADNTYAFVLCSHFLFLYHEQFDLEFHRRSFADMLRVCKPGGKIMVYPTVTLRYEPYPYLDMLIDEWEKVDVQVQFRSTGLPFIPAVNRIVCLIKPQFNKSDD